MPRVQIYCYGCSTTVSVATARSAEDLSRAGWSLVKGETYCSRCGETRAPAEDASSGGGDESAPSEGREAVAGDAGATRSGAVTSTALATTDNLESGFRRRGQQLGQRLNDSGIAASVLAKLRSSRSRRTEPDGAEGPASPFRPVGVALITTLQQPFRRSPVPVTSHSKVSAQTIMLFAVATVLILVTLGSNNLVVRLPGVVFSLAAALSWLRDLRSSS